MRPSHTSVVAFGEMLLRLAAPEGERLLQDTSLFRHYGGAEANVCVLLAQLGVPVEFVSALPPNPLGLGAIRHLKSFGVGTEAVQMEGNRLGLYYHESGAGVRSAKVHYDRAFSAFSQLQARRIPWKEILANAGWLHWSGITPALGPQSIALCEEALRAARDLGVPVSVDLNYRDSLWDSGQQPSAVMPELLSGTRVMNGDLHALDRMLGVTTDSSASIEDRFNDAARQVKLLLPDLEVLAMSFRGTSANGLATYRGALHTDGATHFTNLHVIPVVTDRIGSGDAFMAGLLFGIFRANPWPDVIDFATACGVLKHSVAGDCAQFDESDVRDYLVHGLSLRVNR